MEKELIILRENVMSFRLQIESDCKLTLRNARPGRTCPFLQDRRMLVEQLIGRLSCCQSCPANN